MADSSGGSRNVEVFEKVEQVGEGTYGCATAPVDSQAELCCRLQRRPHLPEQAGLQSQEQGDGGNRGPEEGANGQ